MKISFIGGGHFYSWDILLHVSTLFDSQERERKSKTGFGQTLALTEAQT